MNKQQLLKAELKKLAEAVPFRPFLIETVGGGDVSAGWIRIRVMADNRPALVYKIKTGEHINFPDCDPHCICILDEENYWQLIDLDTITQIVGSL